MAVNEILHLLRQRAEVIRERINKNKTTAGANDAHAEGLDYQADALRDEYNFLRNVIESVEKQQ